MNGSPRERAPDSTATSSGTATHDTDGDASWRDLGDGVWLAAAWRRAGRTSHGDTETAPEGLSAEPESLPDVDAPPSDAGMQDVVPAGATDVDARNLELRTIEETRTGRPEGLLPKSPRPARRAVPLRLAKALRGLGRRVPSRHQNRLDEARTAENGLIDGLWIPYLEPVQERAFDLMLLVDRAPTMPVWGGTVRQLAEEAVHSGAFRDVRTVEVSLPGGGAPVLRWPGNRQADPAELLDGRGARLFLVVTDGLAPGWAERGADELMGRLSAAGPTALVHLLPPTCGTGPRSTPSGRGSTPRASVRSTGTSSATLRTACPSGATFCPRRATAPWPYPFSASAPVRSAPGPTSSPASAGCVGPCPSSWPARWPRACPRPVFGPPGSTDPARRRTPYGDSSRWPVRSPSSSRSCWPWRRCASTSSRNCATGRSPSQDPTIWPRS